MTTKTGRHINFIPTDKQLQRIENLHRVGPYKTRSELLRHLIEIGLREEENKVAR